MIVFLIKNKGNNNIDSIFEKEIDALYETKKLYPNSHIGIGPHNHKVFDKTGQEVATVVRREVS